MDEVMVKDLERAQQLAGQFKKSSEDFVAVNKMLNGVRDDVQALQRTGELNERVVRLIDSYDGAFKDLITGLDELSKNLANAVQSMQMMHELSAQDNI